MLAARDLSRLRFGLIALALWLHPLGPLTKNVPIAIALWVLARAR